MSSCVDVGRSQDDCGYIIMLKALEEASQRGICMLSSALSSSRLEFQGDRSVVLHGKQHGIEAPCDRPLIGCDQRGTR